MEQDLNYVPYSVYHPRSQHGILADVAPSLCHILGIEQPKEMTGRNLIVD